MARIIITNKTSLNVEPVTGVNDRIQINQGISSDRTLLQKRSKKYIQTMTSVDHGSLTKTTGFSELLDKLKEEFGALGIVEYPLGIVSKCYLRNPYEVHVLDLSGTVIINHYKKEEPLPAHLEKARNLAKHNSYAMIEVYANKMILVNEDGSTTKL